MHQHARPAALSLLFQTCVALIWATALISCRNQPNNEASATAKAVPAPAAEQIRNTSENMPDNTLDNASDTAPVKAPEVIAPSTAQAIAFLKQFKNRVDYKSHDSSIWSEVKENHAFERFDSMQTHSSAQAIVKYKSEAQIDVQEKTLIVFDKDPGQTKKADRVFLKNGSLTGKTNSQLWVLTDYGIVKINGGTKQKRGSASVQLNPDQQQLQIQVGQGEAELAYKNKSDQIQKIKISEKNEIKLDAATDLSKFEINRPNSESDVKKIIDRVESVKQVTQADIKLDNPSENENVNQTPYLLTGQLTAIGAKLLINGEHASVDANLTFKKEIPLKPGTNLVVLQLVRSDSTVKFLRKQVVLDVSP